MIPRSGTNGIPFSAACRPAWTAGQVESRIAIEPARIAALKRGASPASPSETAAASTLATRPAPIRTSACSPEVGTASSRRPPVPARSSSRVASIATPE